jgi:hypothetical protein
MKIFQPKPHCHFSPSVPKSTPAGEGWEAEVNGCCCKKLDGGYRFYQEGKETRILSFELLAYSHCVAYQTAVVNHTCRELLQGVIHADNGWIKRVGADWQRGLNLPILSQ